MKRLLGKRCFITGAGQGIGRESAVRFAAEGAAVIAADLDLEKVRLLAASFEGIEAAYLDVCDADAVTSFMRERPVFDVVFNCAGYVHQGSILDCEESAWRRTFDVNVDAIYRICRSVLPGMAARRRGSIINMASVASSVAAVANRFAYSASKAAVIGLTKSIAADFVKTGVRCNAICPGTIRTPSLVERVEALPGRPEDNWQSFVDRQPIGRLGEAAEVAALAAYLAADESAFTTGAIHVIDGGWTA